MARGLAADPPVILMDEPFGAVDPITRQRLQDELLSIQEELHKTIVCVTHDFDEAVKLGDQIVILREGGQIAQQDTPANILAAPANRFVEDFIGAGSTLHAAAERCLAELGELRRGAPRRSRRASASARGVVRRSVRVVLTSSCQKSTVVEFNKR